MSASPETAGGGRAGVVFLLGAVVGWAVLLVAVLARGYLQPHRNSVYPIFANAAREWQAGVDLYDPTLPRPGLDHYRYAPVVAACLVPLTLLPDDVAATMWRALNAVVFLAGCGVFVRVMLPGPK